MKARCNLEHQRHVFNGFCKSVVEHPIRPALLISQEPFAELIIADKGLRNCTVQVDSTTWMGDGKRGETWALIWKIHHAATQDCLGE
uniref:Uncharacterized protein n=1 Tax=Catharanthus roseus TaxID=4058 RepID=C6YBA2_CATRO|nr:hypothetical protein [Catharanthus roseus]